MPDERVRALRVTMTDAERRLWHALRDRRLSGYKFRRQRPIGPFIVDFICIARRLIVEADGGQHADSEYDRRRTAWLEACGWQVIRFWNNDILQNTEGVQQMILEALEAPSPSRSFAKLRSGPLPLPQAGEGLSADEV
jgi:very-short-patch-repair endonuclease